MISVTIPESELFDEVNNEFIKLKGSGIVTEITISLSNSQATQKPLRVVVIKGFWFAICQTAKIAITASGKGNAGSVAAAP